MKDSVYHPTLPRVDYAYLICGVISLIASSVTIVKVHYGSKLQFPYVLMTLSIINSLMFIAIFCSDVIVWESNVEGQDPMYYPYFYVFETTWYLWYLMSI